MKIVELFLIFLLFSSCAQTHFYRETKTESVQDGLVLVVPQTGLNLGSYPVYLLNKKREVVKRWDVKSSPMLAKLDSNDCLHVAEVESFLSNPGVGIAQTHRVYDSSNKIVLSYENPLKHHDFNFLPDGNIAFIVYEAVDPKNYSKKKINSTEQKKLYQGKLWFDKIVVYSPYSKKVVWEWKGSEHFSLDHVVNFAEDVMHANSIEYIQKWPLSLKSGFLVSVLRTNKLYFIDEETKEIIWSSRPDQFIAQHSATSLNNGNILAFNNRKYTLSSEVKEINPKNDEVVWKYTGGGNVYQRSKFYASVMSGAQRLKNGNTLITVGPLGYIFEITPSGEVVWEYFTSLIKTDNSTPWPFPSLFSAQQYESFEPEKCSKASLIE